MPRLIEKVFDQGEEILVYARDRAQLKNIDEALWTYTPLGFLPHGMDGEGFEGLQPILLATNLKAANNAKVCVSLEPVWEKEFAAFDTLIYMFEERDEAAFKEMLRSEHFPLSQAITWIQNKAGTWEKKSGETLLA